MKKIIIVILIFTIGLTIYTILNTQNYTLIEKTITIENIPLEYDGLKIIQFSDLLLGSSTNINDLKKITEMINQTNPDIIIFTGDLIKANYSLTEAEISIIKEELAKLDCTLYKYAVIGDNDNKNLDLYKEIINESNFILLNNESTYIFYKSITPIKLIGIDNINKLNEVLNTDDNLSTAYNILITHYPDYFETLKNEDIDLIFSGHSLLGQIRIPFIGGIIKKELATTYIDNYYEENDTKMYVSSGLGTDKNINFRFNNNPQINLYRLNVKN